MHGDANALQSRRNPAPRGEEVRVGQRLQPQVCPVRRALRASPQAKPPRRPPRRNMRGVAVLWFKGFEPCGDGLQAGTVVGLSFKPLLELLRASQAFLAQGFPPAGDGAQDLALPTDQAKPLL